MRILILILLSIFILNSCHHSTDTGREWKKIFTKNGVNGSFVLYDLNSKEFKYYNKLRADSAYTPASTFKILNSLIALETKVISNENEVIKWDGTDRGWSKWNQDQSMKSAIAVSCVWFYQELAGRIGKTEMKKWIHKIGYGNELMGANIDNFWFEGDLKISAKEQVAFLEGLINNNLPFKQKNQETVKKIMITDSTEHYIIHSKTGLGGRRNPQIGWLIGYIEKAKRIWIFAMNMDILKNKDAKLRKKITYEVLKKEGLITPKP